jgi:hypothetical protein
MQEPERKKGPPFELINIGLPILILLMVWFESRRRERQDAARETE